MQARLLQQHRDRDCRTVARKEQLREGNILAADEQQQVEEGKLVQQWTATGAQGDEPEAATCFHIKDHLLCKVIRVPARWCIVAKPFHTGLIVDFSIVVVVHRTLSQTAMCE